MTRYPGQQCGNTFTEDNGLTIGNVPLIHRHDKPSSQAFHPTESSRTHDEPSMTTNVVGHFHGTATHQRNDLRSNGDIDLALSRCHRGSLKNVRSLLDLKTTIRFIVIIFGYFLGFAAAYSVYVPANRSSEALSSPKSDTYPVMVAQVAGSLMSPLLFGVVSVRESSTPLRQKVISFHCLLLALGVLLSVVSLLLYSLWPAGYRVNNVVTIASLMFAILGGWQSLEKDWKEAAETHQAATDIELGPLPS